MGRWRAAGGELLDGEQYCSLTQTGKGTAMCDYSLECVKSRPAAVGDVLTTHDFGTGTIGFRSRSDRNVENEAMAVCVLPAPKWPSTRPSSRVGLRNLRGHVNGAKRSVGDAPAPNVRTATFLQVNSGDQHTHHDALEFADGSIVLLTQLAPRQHAAVLTLPAKPETRKEEARQRRVAAYAWRILTT